MGDHRAHPPVRRPWQGGSVRREPDASHRARATAGVTRRAVTVARADTPHGEVALRRRGAVLELVVDGAFAMDTVDTRPRSPSPGALRRHPARRGCSSAGSAWGSRRAPCSPTPGCGTSTSSSSPRRWSAWARAGLVAELAGLEGERCALARRRRRRRPAGRAAPARAVGRRAPRRRQRPRLPRARLQRGAVRRLPGSGGARRARARGGARRVVLAPRRRRCSRRCARSRSTATRSTEEVLRSSARAAASTTRCTRSSAHDRPERMTR